MDLKKGRISRKIIKYIGFKEVGRGKKVDDTNKLETRENTLSDTFKQPVKKSN